MSIKIETTELDKLLSSEEFEHLNHLLKPTIQAGGGGEDLLEITEETPEEGE